MGRIVAKGGETLAAIVEEINDIRQLAGCRLLWKKLLAETPGANFFQSLDWLEAYWRHFGRSQRLRVLKVCAAGHVIGILPLVVRSESTRAGRVQVLTYPLENWGTVYGPIGPNPAATLTTALRHVRQTPRDWDMIDLRWVDRHGRDRGRTARAMQYAGFQVQQQVWDKFAVVDIGGSWDDYWAGKSSRWRNNFRRSQRDLAKAGDVTYLRYRPAGKAAGDADPRWDLYDACERIAAKSWQGSSSSGTTLSHLQVRDFLRDAHQAAATAGGLDLNLLYVGGRPVAFAYNYHYQGHVFGLRSGFDASVATAGAGTVLLGRALRDSFHRDDKTYDLGPGSLEAKRYWLTTVESSYRYTHYPISVPRVQALRLKRWLDGRLGRTKLATTSAKSA